MAKRTGMTMRQYVEANLAGKPLATVINGESLEEKGRSLLKSLDDQNNKKREKTAEGGVSKTYTENAPLREKVVEYLTTKNGESVTAKEIATALDLKSAKVSALCKDLIAEEKIERLDLGRNVPLQYRVAVKA